MMKNKTIIRLHKMKYYGMVTAVSIGMFVIISLICVCGLCLTRIDVPDMAVYAVTCFILGMGGYISGMSIGKNKRRKGILHGLICGLWIWGIVSVFGIVYMRELSLGMLLKNFVFLCFPAVIGGIYGVNTKMKRPPY